MGTSDRPGGEGSAFHSNPREWECICALCQASGPGISSCCPHCLARQTAGGLILVMATQGPEKSRATMRSPKSQSS